jgi:hypothetical protein
VLRLADEIFGSGSQVFIRGWGSKQVMEILQFVDVGNICIVTCMSVPVDRVWIGNWIY